MIGITNSGFMLTKYIKGSHKYAISRCVLPSSSPLFSAVFPWKSSSSAAFFLANCIVEGFLVRNGAVTVIWVTGGCGHININSNSNIALLALQYLLSLFLSQKSPQKMVSLFPTARTQPKPQSQQDQQSGPSSSKDNKHKKNKDGAPTSITLRGKCASSAT